ncbi:MAG: hypothetical protein ACJ75J_03395 [Cytophagaceae bacterium]
MRIQGIIFLTLIISLSSCERKTASQDFKEEDIQQLLKQELQNQDRALYGNKNPQVELITDALKVKEIRKIVEAKIEQARIARRNQPQDEYLEIAKNYWSKDRNALKQAVDKLNSVDMEIKLNMILALENMEYRYDHTITEPELAPLIIKCVDAPKLQKDAIQLAGICKVPGYASKFEEIFLEGNSEEEGRIAYWLGQDAGSSKSLALIGKKLLNNEFKPTDVYWVVSAVESFAEKGNPAIKDQAIAVAKEYIRKYGYENEYADDMIGILCLKPDQSSLPMLREALKKDIGGSKVLVAIVTVEGNKSRDRVLKNLQKSFFETLPCVEALGRGQKDEALIREVFEQFGKQTEIYDSRILQFIATVKIIHGEEFIAKADQFINNKKIVGDLQQVYTLSKMTVDEIAADLLSMGLIGKPVSQDLIKAVQEEGSQDYPSLVFSLLEKLSLYHTFDAETGMVPNDYDSLIMDLTRSKKDLAGLLIWMDADVPDYNGAVVDNQTMTEESTSYKITLVDADKAFIIKPEDIGDWYDVPLVLALLNRVSEERKVQERYILLEGGDQMAQVIFGNPAAVQKLRAKYRL